MTTPVFRFAPSPNGFLHLGHAASALLNARLATESGGRFLLRIEDIDTTRCKPIFETAIREDLAWLGLRWEEPVMRQSERFGCYRERLAELEAREMLYPCFCSRADIERDRLKGMRAVRIDLADPVNAQHRLTRPSDACPATTGTAWLR